MTGADYGYLLLCCDLSDGVQPLTPAQVAKVRQQIRAAAPPEQPLRDMTEGDLVAVGCTEERAAQIIALLARTDALLRYLRAAQKLGITPLTLKSPDYPQTLKQKLGENAPPVLFALGDVSLLRRHCVSLVGSRRLTEQGERFARKAGLLAAKEDFALVSGNAAGADQCAQTAAHDADGCVIAFAATSLIDCVPRERTLYLSEQGWHLPFSVPRAYSRNRLIHAMGEKTLVAQTDFETGGTWNGTVENLRHGYSPVFVHDDGSEGAAGLAARGATLLKLGAFSGILELKSAQLSIF